MIMQKKLIVIIISLIPITFFSQEKIDLIINPNSIERKIDDKIYGLLLEHIYHSVSNGLWGETVWNRSFEELLAHGDWTVNNDGVVSLNALDGKKGIFHIGAGQNFEISFDFKRSEGKGAVTLGLRDQYRESMQTNSIYCYFGNQNNTSYDLISNTGWVWHTPRTETKIVSSLNRSLENNKWYSLKVNCNNNHITLWLNGEIFFDEKIENCPKDGAIRIGAENSSVQFRNIKVNSVDNQKTSLSLNPIRHWQLVGVGTISTVTKDVLNHNTAVKISAIKKNTGIEQASNFCIKKSDPLEGSLYLRGDVQSVSVQLIDGNKILAEKIIPNISDNWIEYKIGLKPQQDCDAATLRIISESKGELYVDQVSLMNQSSIDNDGYRTDLYNVTKALKPTIIRWPGGSFVELYDFAHGIGKQSSRKGIQRWDDFDPLSFGTDEFISYCKKVGAEPQIVLPIGYHNYEGYKPDMNEKKDWLKYAQNWLEYCNGDITTEWGAKRAANGHSEPYNVKYWEIDNEVWKMNPELYSHLVRIYSQTLKQQDPSIKIIGCGSGRLGKEGIGLDSILIKTSAEYIDYISPHHYVELDKFGNNGIKEYQLYLERIAKWISESKNPNLKIYVSEWNLDKLDLRTGLFAGGILNLFEKKPSVEMAACALVLRHTSAPGWNNAFINFDQKGYFVAPNYVVMKLWRDHFAPNLITTIGDNKKLNIVSTKSDDGSTIFIKIVNPSNEDYHINLSIQNSFDVHSANISIVTADDLTTANSMNSKDVVKSIKKNIIPNKNNVSTIIPKYSASVITINKAQ